MAIVDREKTANLEPALESLLARLRRRIRSYVLVDSVAVAAIVAGTAFWLSLTLDWLFEPPRALRIMLLASAVAALGYIVLHLLFGRLATRLSDRNMALVLERRFGDFRDALLTSVELSEAPEHAADFNTEMLAHTHRDALERSKNIDLSQVLNNKPLHRRLGMALALALSLGVFAVAANEAMGVWVRRNLLFSDELWPRRTHLAVDGFDERGHIKIARGSDLELKVRADAATGRVVPEIVQVRYSTEDGARGRENLSSEGGISAGDEPFQNYSHTFKSVLSPVEFYVLGGDDRQGPFHIDVVDSPTISRMSLHCEYPEYMHRAPRDIPVAGVMELARGTRITIHAEANKPLVSVKINTAMAESSSSEAGGDAGNVELALAQEGQATRSFDYSPARLDADQTLLFSLFDTDNIRSREAVRLSLRAVPDEPPQVNVQLKGIGTAMTPSALLPASGEVSDDYGVEQVWFRYHADDDEPQKKEVQVLTPGAEKVAVADGLEVRDLGLQPKQKFHWSVQAADAFSLDSPPNVGTSQKYVIDVVTPEQLRSMLEARELMLRRRFEVIVEELSDTRKLLDEIEVAPPVKAVTPASAAADANLVPPPEPGAVVADDLPRERPLTVQVERVLQNTQRSSHETLQVAIAFDDIRAEMVNNRVDTEELKVRLKDGVADPLKRIVEARFPKFEADLKRLLGQLADPAVAAVTRGEALAEIDGILAEMRMILSKMLELETFNEVLDMLREIIGTQEKINTDTKARQRQRLQDLTD